MYVNNIMKEKIPADENQLSFASPSASVLEHGVRQSGEIKREREREGGRERERERERARESKRESEIERAKEREREGEGGRTSKQV